jgi:hypothetical protein
VGNSDYLLYRSETAGPDLPAGLGRYNFSLQQAYAQLLTPASLVLPATVTNGSLTLDFAARAFSTSLGLSSAPTGNVSLSAAGSIRSDGIFVERGAQQVVGGAAALDGKSAGYLFEKSTNSGTLSGITLWGR